MRVGLTLPLMEPGLDRDTLRQWCRRVDEGPFSSLAMGERIAFVNPEFMTTLAAAAAWTERVPLLSTVVILTMHNPVLIAKQLATVDVISNGRLSVGVGIGGRREDYLAVGADWGQHRASKLAEYAQVMRRTWAGECVVEGLNSPVEPKPVQQGGPPLLAGALGPKAIEAAASWANGVTGFSFGPDVGEIAGSFELARGAWRRNDRPPPRLVGSFWVALGSGAREQMNRHLRRYLNWLPGDDVQQMLPHTGFAGSATELRELLGRIIDLGADEVILSPTTTDPDEVDRLADIVG